MCGLGMEGVGGGRKWGGMLAKEMLPFTDDTLLHTAILDLPFYTTHIDERPAYTHATDPSRG